MILTHPSFLWLLIPFVALWWWRLRRASESRQQVSTLTIWQQLVAEQGQGEKAAWRIPWRLIAELLAGFLLILTLANPAFVEEEALLILVDQGGSMGAPSRVTGAGLIVEELEKEHRGSAQVVRLAQDKNGASPHWERVLSASRCRGRTIEIVSDFLADFVRLPREVGFRSVSDSVRNVGFVAARALPAAEGGVTLFVAIGRTANEVASKVEVQVLMPNTSSPTPSFSFPGGVGPYQQKTLPLMIPEDVDNFTIRLSKEDDLSFDNELTFLRPHPARLVFARMGKESESLQALWDAVSALGLNPIMSTAQRANADEVGVSWGLPLLGAGGNLVVAATSLPTKSLENFEIMSEGSDDFRDLPGIKDWVFGRCFQTPLPRGFQSLVRVKSGPVVVKQKSSRTILVAGDPIESQWAEKAFFPLMIKALLAKIGFTEANNGQAWESPDLAYSTLESRLRETQASSSPEKSRPASNSSSHIQPWGPWLGLIVSLLLLGLALDYLRRPSSIEAVSLS